MTIANGDIIRAAARMTTAYGENINVYHFRANLVASQTDEDVIDAIITHLGIAYAHLNPYLTSGQTPTDIKMDIVEWTGTPLKEEIVRGLGIHSWDAGVDPAGAGDDLPPGVCALIKWRTPGVKTLLRKFYGILIESDRQGGGWIAGMVTAMGQVGAQLLVPHEISAGNTLSYGTWSKRAAAFVEASGYVVSLVEAYQRRRKFGVGA